MTDSFQARSSGQGRKFEDLVALVLDFLGWKVDEMRARVAKGFPTVDIVATDPVGEKWWIECKGANGRSQRAPGLLDVTTTKVAIGAAAILRTLSERRRYLLVTSHLPKPGSLSESMLDVALTQGLFSDVLDLGALVTFSGTPADDDDEQEEGWTG